MGHLFVIQVEPLPPEQCWVLQVKLFTYFAYAKDLNFVRRRWGKNLVKVMFMSVYGRLAVNSIKKTREEGEVSQNLLARIVVTLVIRVILVVLVTPVILVTPVTLVILITIVMLVILVAQVILSS